MEMQVTPSSFFQEQRKMGGTQVSGGDNSFTQEEQIASDYQTFLRLMTAQLENQDPLSPMDPTQFLSQIAQFTTVEQQLRTNANLEQIASTLGSSVDRLDLSYLGRQVEALGDIVGLKGENTPKFAYALDANAEEARIVIQNEKGEPVRTMDAELLAGRHDLVWDGKGDNGKRLPDGLYRIHVVAKDEEGNAVNASVAITDQVEEVLKINGKTWLALRGGSSILPENVMVVTDPLRES